MLSGLSAILLWSAVMMFSVGLVFAQQNENVTSSEPSFLGVQSAQSGSISQVNDTAYTLELNDVSDKTILFSDRPDRIVGSVNTTDFIGNWSTGPDSFAADPPNAVLVLDDEEQRQDLAVIELHNPVYDSEANTLSYDITAENATSIGLPNKFGQSTMIIDTEYNINVKNESTQPFNIDPYQKKPSL
jgi:hypothetical protein